MTTKSTPKKEGPMEVQPPWLTAIKRDLPGGGRAPMVRLVDLLLWIADTERLGVQEALGDMLLRLDANPDVPIYLAWEFAPVQVVVDQDFGLRRRLNSEIAASLLDGAELMPDGEFPLNVTPGRSAALYRFRDSLKDDYSSADVTVSMGLFDSSDPVFMMSNPAGQWRAMAVTGQDAASLWSTDGQYFELQTYSDLVVDVRRSRAADIKVAWGKCNRSRILADEVDRRRVNKSESAALEAMAKELDCSRQALSQVLKAYRSESTLPGHAAFDRMKR